jgi:DNA-binding PadR family transcriptional regulator
MYEMTKNIRRTLHWLWPQAESQIYAEAKRLVARGLAQAATQAVGARRRTVYAITPDGRAALEQVHVRALLFDALWSLGLTLHLWAERSQAEVARWADLELADNEERALRTIREALAHFPLARRGEYRSAAGILNRPISKRPSSPSPSPQHAAQTAGRERRCALDRASPTGF